MSKLNTNPQPPSTTTASEVREHLSDLLNMVRFGNQNIVIEKSGSPYAVLISIDSWDEYKKYLREKARKAIQSVHEKNKHVDIQKLEKDIEQARAEVHALQQ